MSDDRAAADSEIAPGAPREGCPACRLPWRDCACGDPPSPSRDARECALLDREAGYDLGGGGA